MKAISLHQPYPSLCVTRRPCICGPIRPEPLPCICPMVKRFETRTWACPPNLIGSRIALHATKKAERCFVAGDVVIFTQPPGLVLPDGLLPEEDLPLGAVVGSAVIEACYPIVDLDQSRTLIVQRQPHVWVDRHHLKLWRPDSGLILGGDWDNLADQDPYGDYRPDRYAWLLTDAKPVQERCPWCWADAVDEDGVSRVCSGSTQISGGTWSAWAACPVCSGAGRCEPIPARGRQRIWNWHPA